MTAQQAFERVQPHLAAAGVTRVAEITGLDRIGIPTFISVRPLSRTIAVDAGKGVTVEAARASAAFESIERHVAETAEIPTLLAALIDFHDGAEVETNLPRIRGSVLERGYIHSWAWARDVNDDGRPVAVPLAAVRLMAGDEGTLASWVWASTSNGLAAATCYEAAVFQALCEVIERDACACHQWAALALAREDAEASNEWLAGKCFAPECWAGAGDAEGIEGLLEKIHAAGCEVRCFDFSMADTKLPVVECFIYEPGAPEAGIFKGYGAHLDPRVALRRAITEAVQARCVIVAGARDDIDSEKFALTRGELSAEYARLIHAFTPGKRFPRNQQMITLPPADLARHLCFSGFPRVLVYDFGAHHGAHVVRVIVPGLVGYWTPKAPVDERMEAFAELERGKLKQS